MTWNRHRFRRVQSDRCMSWAEAHDFAGAAIATTQAQHATSPLPPNTRLSKSLCRSHQHGLAIGNFCEWRGVALLARTNRDLEAQWGGHTIVASMLQLQPQRLPLPVGLDEHRCKQNPELVQTNLAMSGVGGYRLGHCAGRNPIILRSEYSYATRWVNTLCMATPCKSNVTSHSPLAHR